MKLEYLMMNTLEKNMKNELEIKIEVDGKKIPLPKELVEQIKNAVSKDDSFPQVGDAYWVISDEGVVEESEYEKDIVDSGRKMIGNRYRTREEAQTQVDKLKAIVRVKKYIKETLGYDSETWMDWEDDEDEKWSIIYDYGDKEFHNDYWYTIKSNSYIGYLKTREDCDKLEKAMPDDLLLICK